MPHIVIKTLTGKSKQELAKAAEAAAKAVGKALGKPDKYLSVSVEEYGYGEWESVYNEYIKNADNVYVKPGYTNPKTFE